MAYGIMLPDFSNGKQAFLLSWRRRSKESKGTTGGTHTQLSWTVDDIKAEVADLKARGVVFEEYDTPYLKTVESVATTGPIKAAWFKDSEGNLLGLVQFV